MGQQKKKEEVVEEYLKGGVSLRELGEKYSINHRTIHRWVKGHQKGEVPGVRKSIMSRMPNDVRRLQRDLYEERLRTKLLETMIEIAETEMGIPIRKKSGAK